MVLPSLHAVQTCKETPVFFTRHRNLIRFREILCMRRPWPLNPPTPSPNRSEEHTSELQSLMRISYAVFCLKKKKNNRHQHNTPLLRTEKYIITKNQEIEYN